MDKHNDRPSIRLAELTEPFYTHIATTGESAGEYIRRLIAADLGVESPSMAQGFAASGKAKSAQKRAISARKKNSRKNS